MLSRAPCAICGEPGRPLYEGLRDRLFGVPGEWSLWRCSRCALVWLDPPPSASEQSALYHDYYTHEEAPAAGALRRAVMRGIPRHTLGYHDAPCTRGERALGRLLAVVPPLREIAERAHMTLPASRRGHVLDVGCGSGHFLERMRELGWKVTGVEADPEAARSARRRLGDAAVHCGRLGALARTEPGFDAVTLSHVLEHLPKPEETLRECHARLRPGGWLVVTTPNTASLGRRRFGREWLHWDPPRHLHLFDPSTLDRVCRSAGFEVRRLETPSSSAHFVYRAGRLLERDSALPGARVDRATALDLLGALCFQARESWLVSSGRRCGEELLLVAERPRDAAAPEQAS